MLWSVSVETGKVLRKWTPPFLASWLDYGLSLAGGRELTEGTPNVSAAVSTAQPKLLVTQHVAGDDQTCTVAGVEQEADRAEEPGREPLLEPAEAAATSSDLSDAAATLRYCALKIGLEDGATRSRPSSQVCSNFRNAPAAAATVEH